MCMFVIVRAPLGVCVYPVTFVRLYVCVSWCKCKRICSQCMVVKMYVCISACVCARMCMCVCVCVCACARARVCVCAWVCLCPHACVCVQGMSVVYVLGPECLVTMIFSKY